MKNSPEITEAPVPLAEAAAAFGFRDTQHFSGEGAQRVGLRLFKLGARWFCTRSELDAALSRNVSKEAK